MKPTNDKIRFPPAGEALVGFAHAGDLFCVSLHHSHTQRNNIMVIGSAHDAQEHAKKSFPLHNPARSLNFSHTHTKPFFALPCHSCKQEANHGQETTQTEYREDSVLEMLVSSRRNSRHFSGRSLRQQARRSHLPHLGTAEYDPKIGSHAGMVVSVVDQKQIGIPQTVAQTLREVSINA